jgi:Fic family protein
MTVPYRLPEQWLRYDARSLIGELAEAKAAVMSLTATPYPRSWAEKLQKIQLKQEVAGTSRIEGAEFTERELDAALRDETPAAALNRSQRQARAAINTYRWIADLPNDRPVTTDLIREVHRRIVTGCDDDHCPPGVTRSAGNNVTFGTPRHRGVEGGRECDLAFRRLGNAVEQEFRRHDPLIQGLALHYHIGAMHPFLDGNGRTARALEALFLQRAGLRNELFIAMSNYYYNEKPAYLAALAEGAAAAHDLTAFLRFGLKGIAVQCNRLLAEIRLHVLKSLFRDMMYDLFSRLKSKRRRVIGERQIGLLKTLLEEESIGLAALYDKTMRVYTKLKTPRKAYLRDVVELEVLGTLELRSKKTEDGGESFVVAIRLDWPTQITETEFFARVQKLPKAKTHPFLR